MATIENFVNLPSEADYQEIIKKFPAFASASLSEKAKKDGACENSDYKAGYYFTRTALPGSSIIVMFVNDVGDLFWDIGDGIGAGLRVALQTIYNPECNLVKGCKEVSRTAEIWDKEKRKAVKTTSKTPVVTFGKKDYIWLNKDECENGKEKSMRLVSLELIARAKPFDKDGDTNDYGSEEAKKLRQQCQDEAFEFATEEEKKLLVKVKLSEKDGYEKEKPILKKEKSKEQNQKKSSVESLFDDLFAGKIDEEGLRKGLKEIVASERAKQGASVETAKALNNEIVEQAKLFQEKLEAKRVDKEFDNVNSTIDKLNLGGKQ